MSEWINVEDKLPDKDGSYLCQTHAKVMAIMMFMGEFIDNFWRHEDVTHWQPLPEPPQQN